MKMVDIEELDVKHPPQDREVYERAYEEAVLSFEIARVTYALRTQAGLTQAELAERMGTSQPAIARMESGGHTPSLDMLDRLGQALGQRLRLVAEPVEIPATQDQYAITFGAVAAA